MSNKEVKALRKENAELLQKISDLSRDFESLKSRIMDGDGEETERSLQFLSDEYDSFKGFSRATSEEIKKLSAALGNIEERAKGIEDSVERLQQYSYQYNLKITGIPQMSKDESALDTSKLCVKLFHQIGVSDVSIQDIDIAHRLPNRHRGNESRPPTIICKFNRRLPREAVLKKRSSARNIKACDIGIDSGRSTGDRILILEHLTPKTQDLFNKCKEFQRNHNYKFCWAKHFSIFMKYDEDSNVIRITKEQDLDDLNDT